jgi:FixJ family two-component response regulator
LDKTPILLDRGHQDIKPVREIFIADDDEDVRNLLAATLAPEGFPVTSFEDGDSLLMAVGTRVPICIFLDVVMPQQSGIEVLRQLRAQKCRAPTFLISAQDDLPTVVEAMKNGAQDFIKKPFDCHAPRLRVRSAVAMWSRQGHSGGEVNLQAYEGCEQLRLTPRERDALLFNRLIDSYSRS